jgi:hypothetical protein
MTVSFILISDNTRKQSIKERNQEISSSTDPESGR